MKPCQARTADDLMKLRSDNFPRDNSKWSILATGDRVSLHPPADGEGKAFYVTIPTDEFAAIARWFLRDQKPARG